MATGAVVAGRGTFEPAGGWGGDHHDGVPIFIVSRGAPDELEIHLVPVLLGEGRRLFEHLGPQHIELERTRVLEGEAGVTHMHYRVITLQA
jgi:dihydrofolate reductase